MRRRRLESYDDYERALRNGFGRGCGEDYTPWIRTQDVASHGLSSKLPGIIVHRQHHLLSNHERRLFLCVEYQSNVIDIREQFPLLPVDLTSRIAEQAGIPYENHRKSKDPKVLTTDFLLTISENGKIRYIAISVKPASELRETRVRQILDIERLWWYLLGVEWRLVTDEQLDRQIADNLDWLSDVKRGIKEESFEKNIPENARELILKTLSSGPYLWEVRLVGHPS
ncbi:MAG: TnsA endonuclease N-terminal domain-containing protein [Gammaproteobacteria bacterium]|nr:TnsA endonuclease N-terminal domain-containing protein [Gammaproteobacteria bacterium]